MIVRTATVIAREDAAESGPRVLDVRLVAWNTPADVSDDGRTRYSEEWAPGSLVVDDGEKPAVYAGHVPTPAGPERGPLIGVLDNLRDDGDGFYGEAVLGDTVVARETWSLARLAGATVSIEADVDPTPPRPGQRVVRTAERPATLTGAAILLRPNRGAIPGATVLAARSTLGGNVTLLDTPTEPDAPDAPDPDPVDPDAITVGRAHLEETIRRELVRARLPQLPEAGHPLSQYRTFAAFADAAYDAPGSIMRAIVSGGDRPLGAQLSRAWVDQVTTANPGVIPPGWMSEVFGIVAHGRPVITGIGTRPLPPDGMDVNWPYFDGDLYALVGEQLTQKTDITSVLVSLKKGTAPIRTFAGGSDLSYQLIRRSSPSYRDAYLRIMSAAWAAVTDREATEDLYDQATGYIALPAGATVDVFRAAVFSASVAVENATGSPASVVLLATDAFVKFGAALLPANYGTFNQSGTASASTLDVNVSGLSVVHARSLPNGTGIVTNGQAASWSEDGPFAISAPDVPKLGEDTAIWGMAALETFVPAGVVVLAATAPVAADAGTRKRGKAAAE